VLLTEHFSGDQSQRMSWAGHVEHMTRDKAHKVLVWKPEDTGWVGVERINLHLDRYKQQALVYLLMNFQVPYIVENFWTL